MNCRNSNYHKMDERIFTIDYLIKQFLCGTPIKEIDFFSRNSTDLSLDADIQQKIVDGTVHNSLVKKYPLKYPYQAAFLNLLMKKIEESGNEIVDDVMCSYCDVICKPDAMDWHFRHFLIENGTLSCITIEESTKIVSRGTTGLSTWQAAISLSEWCRDNKHEFRGKTVLELGCGVGLTGLNIISTCNPKGYTFLDGSTYVTHVLSKNIRHNLVPSNIHKLSKEELINGLELHLKYGDTDVKVLQLRWEDIPKYTKEEWEIPDVVIAADILYDIESFEALISALDSLLHLDKNYVIMAATNRNENTIQAFLDELVKHNLSFEDYDVQQSTRKQLTNSSIRILRIFRRE
ncbi:hypothetical protein KM043_015269 [Ampulex compressa]|nr:hypothetical protein KM043_015269 [Ampulex compressa]